MLKNTYNSDFLLWLKENTTKEQFEAITYTQGPLLIAAGAGSGKTRVITFKIAYLISCGMSADRILAVTFTNKAAREMQERVKDLIGLTPSWIRTFHSAGVRILRSYGSQIGLNSRFQIATENEQDLILKEISSEFNQAKSRRQAKMFISNLKNKYFQSFINKQELNFHIPNFRFTTITPERLFSQYEKIKTQYGYLDFDDLLIKVIELLENRKQIKERLQGYFQYILVDEYQDINPAQERILRLLSTGRNITVVGDDYQSIYGFRGAEIKNFLNFKQNYKARIIVLGCNFRSTQTIVEASSRLIQNNPHQVHKGLYAYNQIRQPIIIVTFDHEYEEAEFISQKVKELSSKGLKYKDIAVLYRSAYISYTLQHELLKAGIPVIVVGDTFFFRRQEVKIIILFLRSTFQNDRLALIQLLSERFFKGFGKKGLEKIRPFLEEGKDILGTLEELISFPKKGTTLLTRQQKTTLEVLLQGMKKIKAHPIPQDSIHSLLSTYEGIWNEFLKKISEDPKQLQERLRNIHEFMAFANAYSTMDEFLDEIALLADKTTGINEKNAVQLLTIHKAKGLEWETVFLLGADQGIFPSRHALENSSEFEEERRLFYVAMTRAKRFLFITHAESRHSQGYNISSFVHEIPSECTKFIEK